MFLDSMAISVGFISLEDQSVRIHVTYIAFITLVNIVVLNILESCACVLGLMFNLGSGI